MCLEKFLESKDICKQLKIGTTTLFNWRNRYNFPAPIKVGRKLLWKKSDIEAYLESKKVNASESKPEKN
jgi:predicted DNA-binding transcriptional regulator AlpA